MDSTATTLEPATETWVTPLYVYQQGAEPTPPTLAIMRGSYENPEILVKDLHALPNAKKYFPIKKVWEFLYGGV